MCIRSILHSANIVAVISEARDRLVKKVEFRVKFSLLRNKMGKPHVCVPADQCASRERIMLSIVSFESTVLRSITKLFADLIKGGDSVTITIDINPAIEIEALKTQIKARVPQDLDIKVTSADKNRATMTATWVKYR
jgi:hypothetical protein